MDERQYEIANGAVTHRLVALLAAECDVACSPAEHSNGEIPEGEGGGDVC